MKYLKEYKEINWDEDWEEEDPVIPTGEPREFYEQYIGRKVMMRSSSKFYKIDLEDPLNTVGTIRRIRKRILFIEVKWKNDVVLHYKPKGSYTCKLNKIRNLKINLRL